MWIQQNMKMLLAQLCSQCWCLVQNSALSLTAGKQLDNECRYASSEAVASAVCSNRQQHHCLVAASALCCNQQREKWYLVHNPLLSSSQLLHREAWQLT